MGWGWIVPLVIVLFLVIAIATIVRMVMGSMGIDWADMIRAIRGTRRIKMEIEPRDHYDRWVESHRRSSKDNKPVLLKWLWYTGDVDVPTHRQGRIIGLEKWKSTNVVYVKRGVLSWSMPYLIPEEMSQDVHGKNLIVHCRGFSSNGPVRLPIPLAGQERIQEIVMRAWRDWEYLFRLQTTSDITENMAWGVDQAMQPPYRALRMAADVQQPRLAESQPVKEEEITQ